MKTLRLKRNTLSFVAIMDGIAKSFKEDHIFPDVIEMDIDDYLEFPLMFVNPNIGTIKDGYVFLGIKIKPYFEYGII